MKTHAKVPGTQCIFHPNCATYGIHRDETCKNKGHLAADSVIHVRQEGSDERLAKSWRHVAT